MPLAYKTKIAYIVSRCCCYCTR